MKLTDHRLQLTVLILLFLPLFGWGCADKSAVSNKTEAGQDTVALVDTSVSVDATKSTDTNAPDTIKPLDTIKPKDTAPDTTAKDTSKDVSNVPEGWKVWEDKTFKVAYPGMWYAKADNIQNPQPLDLKRVFFDQKPITTGDGTEPFYLAMLENWSGTTKDVLGRYTITSTNIISIDGQTATRFTYSAEIFEDIQPVVYVMEKNNKVFVLQRLDGQDSDLQTMLKTLVVF